MGEVRTYTLHTIRQQEPNSDNVYLLSEWKPEKPTRLIGASITLLCRMGTGFELYAAVSRSPDLDPRDWYVGLKRNDILFYCQRDAYHACSGVHDLTQTTFLPPGSYFLVSPDQPVYIKVGVGNFNSVALEYDVLVILYYEEV